MKSQRNTKQKKIILDELKCADHPTATELYGLVHMNNPSISRGTVFRVLAQFADSGVVNKLSLPGCPARFDAVISPHAHARCVCCGRVFDVLDADVAPLFEKKSFANFKVYSANIDFSGCCERCQSEKGCQ